MSFVLRIGSRKSTLAKLQSLLVRDALLKAHPDLKIDLFFKEASGDQDLSTPLWKMGTRGVFTQDLTKELVDGNVDLVVHSYKDLDLEGHPGTEIVMALPRADQRDVLLWKKSSFLEPPELLRIHSSSPRREYNLTGFLSYALPARLQGKPLEFRPVRGNVQTRVRKWLEDSGVSGIVVAKAALDRLLADNFSFSQESEYSEIRNYLRSVLDENLFMILPLSVNPNAPAQGALAAEYRSGDSKVLSYLAPLRMHSEEKNVIEERKILSYFGGGCHQKIGVACINVEEETYLFLRGKSDSGEVLNSNVRLENRSAFPRPNSWEDVFPQPKQGFELRRVPLSSSPPAAKEWFVSKADAIPDSWTPPNPDTILSVAGTKTWKKLASRDFWVHSSTDGIGEENATSIDTLLGRVPKFVKLTHEDSEIAEGVWERYPTYKVEFSEKQPDLSKFTHFFWMSGSQFERALRSNPGISDKVHSCGAGSTYKIIKKTLGNEAKVYAFPNYESWVHACKGEQLLFSSKQGSK
ncbi:uroporphyrinogen synthase [Leptospira perolatii]|uniref:hydroxymethylbilane synthase n=1 Tax=Leptospira perolatii TaxID=2023191 RepID=A0A2M9ZPE7_9LEPT|nr:hydroxymethylbilane synthase [Leptospira perolatii]PJZ70752.1 uroporphyrinogen synthase [Leptospira perolatii]PJZ73960.1 uroporphyrinogen synthase [Leptospira perolatii]